MKKSKFNLMIMISILGTHSAYALNDMGPNDIFEMKGENLWKAKRGPNDVSLETCDLGKGAGVVRGAFVELPRYFKDTKKVQDLESRLMTCMASIQGFDQAEIIKTPFGKGEQVNITAMATWIAAQSRGLNFNVPQSHPEEKQAYAIGKKLFYQSGGSHDFSCASCHSKDNVRIRLQDLPNLSGKGDETSGISAWPSYRVSNGEMWGMQQRLTDCYRQQRFPYPSFSSDAITSLSTFLAVNNKGVMSIAPSIKR